MSKPNLMKELYSKHVTPEVRKQVEHMTDEECGIIFLTEKK